MNLLLIVVLACCCAHAQSNSHVAQPRCYRGIQIDTSEVVETFCPGKRKPPTNAIDEDVSTTPKGTNTFYPSINVNNSNKAPYDCTTEERKDAAPESKDEHEHTNDGQIKPEKNPEKLNYVDHRFFRSGFVSNKTYFNAHWKNITSGPNRIVVHPTLKELTSKHVFRDFAVEVTLPFDFPYYGHHLKKVTVSTGGYLFTGQYGHRWFTQEQCIAPLMANFDLSLADNSAVVLYEEETRVTFVWENLKIRVTQEIGFTFSVTLYNNGDIYFAYKMVPIEIPAIDCRSYSVFVGVADSYFVNEITLHIHRKFLHNYSRIPFNTYDIDNYSIIQLIAQRSCPIYDSCNACIQHHDEHGNFQCMWCDTLQKCTSGADFHRPLVTECPFTSVCSSDAYENENLPTLRFFNRILKFTKF